MRVAMVLGGTDLGRSGIGMWVRAVAPRMDQALSRAGGKLLAIGTAEELDVYGPYLGDAERIQIPSAFGAPGPNALWHLTSAGHVAAKARADVLLLPAANRRLTWSSPVPVVAVVHDLAQLKVKGKYDRFRMAYVRHVVVRALRGAGSLVAVSRATKDEMVGASFDGDRIRVVSNGVDMKRFRPPEDQPDAVEAARAHAGLEPGYVLYLSRLEHPGKNHARLLEAFAQGGLAERHELVLAGADWGAGPMLKQKARDLGIAHRTRWLGFVPDEHVAGLVAGSHAMVMVGLAEGFGLPALEALAAGRPVLASDRGALPEVVGELGILCDPLRVESIREGLEKACGDAAWRRRIAEEGPAWASRFSWQRSVDELVETCRGACGR